MRPFIHVQSAATWRSMSHPGATPFAPFAFGRMTTSCWDFRLWQEARTVSVFTRRSSSSSATAHLSIGSQVMSADQQSLTGATHSGDHSTRLATRTCVGIRRRTANVGVHLVRMLVYTTGEMTIGYRNRTWANQSATANRRPAGQLDGSGNLSAIVAADRAFPAAIAELGR